jgi:hypothetical protein
MPCSVKVISYSALSNFQHCPWYYKLVNIERLAPFQNTVYTHWGTLIHKYIQLALQWSFGEAPNLAPDTVYERHPEMGDRWAMDYAFELSKRWLRFCSLYKQDEKVKGWHKPGFKAITDVNKSFTEQFGKFKVLKIEERLSLPSGEPFPQQFKGFIDIVLETEDGKIIIIDFKTCDNTWKFNKYRDKYKDYQLTLYKHFYCLKHNVDPKNVETYFVTLERSERSKKPLQFVRVTSGPKKVKNALGWLQRALKHINKSFYLKNRIACHKFSKPGLDETHACVFYGTEHCVSSV